MKTLFVLMAVLSIFGCHNKQKVEQKDAKNVSEVVAVENKPLQNTEITVTGKITGNLFFFGKGAYRLADTQEPEIALTVLTKDGITRTKGDTITVRVSRNDVLRINGSSWVVYSEL